jgi:restriction system protein
VGRGGWQAGRPGLRRQHGLHQALDFVDRIEGKKVVLIDGDRLADLMIEHGLGVTTTKVYELKEVSNDFFDESEG